jgi:hypothetical protein
VNGINPGIGHMKKESGTRGGIPTAVLAPANNYGRHKNSWQLIL